MAETITTAVQSTLCLPTSDVWNIVDATSGGGGRNVTFGTASVSTYWRHFLASSATPGTPSTTASAPKSLLAHVENIVNAAVGHTDWHFAVNAAGLTTIRYSGAGTGVLTFTGSLVKSVLGIATGTASLSFSSGETKIMPQPPTFTAYMTCCSKDTNWQDDPPYLAIGEMRDGSTYCPASDSSAVQTRTFDSRFHPYDYASRAAYLGMSATDPSGTPLRGDSSRRKVRAYQLGTAAAPVALYAPWGMDDFFYAAPQNGGRCGALLGTFQGAVAATTTTYDEVYLSADTIAKAAGTAPSVANWIARSDIPGITLRWYATVSF